MKNAESYIASLFQLMHLQKGFNSLVFMRQTNPILSLCYKINEREKENLVKEPTWHKKQAKQLFNGDFKQLDQLVVELERENKCTLPLRNAFLTRGIIFSKPLKFKEFHWGYLVLFFNTKKIDQATEKSIGAFSELICQSMYQQHVLTKANHELENTKKTLSTRKKIIESLKNRIGEQNKQIENFKNNKVEFANFKWNEEVFELEELWLSIQGYTNGEIDPVISKWCKIQDMEVYEQLNNMMPFRNLNQIKRA